MFGVDPCGPPSHRGATAWQIEKGCKENLAAFFYLDLKRYKPTTLQMPPFENERMEDPESARIEFMYP